MVRYLLPFLHFLWATLWLPYAISYEPRKLPSPSPAKPREKESPMKKLILLLLFLTLIGCDEQALKDAAQNAAEQANKENTAQDQAGYIPGRELTATNLEQNFFCYNGDDKYNFYIKPDGSATASVRKTNQQFQGQYKINDGKISFSFPQAGYSTESGPIEVALGLIINFDLPNLKCHAVQHTLGQREDGYVKCPTIRWIPSVSYQKNSFEFHGTGMVRWRQWDELTGANDTLYSEAYGIYLRDGDRLYMAFGAPGKGHDKYLTAKVLQGNQVLIDQLEPEKGACKPN